MVNCLIRDKIIYVLNDEIISINSLKWNKIRFFLSSFIKMFGFVNIVFWVVGLFFFESYY